mgnify:CR=1 FL=1
MNDETKTILFVLIFALVGVVYINAFSTETITIIQGIFIISAVLIIYNILQHIRKKILGG